MERGSITSLASYQYDALDRLVSRVSAGQHRQHRFYQKERIVSEIEGNVHRQIFQSQEALLAERETERVPRTSLLTTDTQRSVLQNFDSHSAYSPYGHRTVTGGLSGLLGFNGERPDPDTEHYLLGNGHRGFNPTLMRFNSPDSLSPFGTGGLNCYVYCGGDPINRSDPTGKSWYAWAWFTNAAVEFGGAYVAPRLPSRLARRIPGVMHPNFYRASKAMAAVSGFAGASLYLVMNQVELHHPDSLVNDPLFYAYLTIGAVGFLSGLGITAHKLAIRPAALPKLPSQARPRAQSLQPQSLQPRASQLPRRQSQPDISRDFGKDVPAPVANDAAVRFDLRRRFSAGDFQHKLPIAQSSAPIRRPSP
jgi:RHS repeat-associated protein